MPTESFERYCCQEEADATRTSKGLMPRPGHEQQPKWIAEIGRVRPQTLGKRKNYQYKLVIETQTGTREWLQVYEKKPDIEPGRYGIPAGKLEEFNCRIITITVIDRKTISRR